nr:MAG TPA: hypothetical protein [Bacteriophage sp.]
MWRNSVVQIVRFSLYNVSIEKSYTYRDGRNVLWHFIHIIHSH